MIQQGRLLRCTSLLAGTLAALTWLSVTSPVAAQTPSPSSLNTGLRFLYQNDLDWQRAADSSHRQPGYILLSDKLSSSKAESACQALGETLLHLDHGGNADEGLKSQLRYLAFEGATPAGQQFWITDGRTISIDPQTNQVVVSIQRSQKATLPAICTQSAPWHDASWSDTSARWQVATNGGGVQFTGYRDALSFRFTALPYANPTQRFAYSTVYDVATAGSSSVDALYQGRGRQCPQTVGAGAGYQEQCLYTNVYTPYLPSPSQVAAREQLRPILVWLHGGGFMSGSGQDVVFDGGNLASRSDFVVISPNFRLGTLGHLAYDDQIRGNYGLGDVLTLLKWIQRYGPAFGGDPSRVTISGQSSGAQHVNALLASPAAAGLFRGAIPMSCRPQDTDYKYSTIPEARAGGAGASVSKLGCSSASDVLACLRSKSVEAFLDAPFVGLVQDGRLLNSRRLDLRAPQEATGHVNRVPVMIGHMRDEQAALGVVPPSNITDVRQGLAYAGLSTEIQDTVVSNPAAFPVDEYGVQNLTVTVNTETKYSCGIRAMAYAGAANGAFPSVYSYLYSQRSFQLPDYDPNSACTPKDGNPASKDYYRCHSGELMAVFGTTGSAYRLPYRDDGDLPWITLVMDQISAFVRTGSPSPDTGYLQARGAEYATTLARATQGTAKWRTVNANGQYRAMSFGPTQSLVSLAAPLKQCDVLGKPLDYIANLAA